MLVNLLAYVDLNAVRAGIVKLFRYRCRYFTDAGVLGSKRFVREVFEGIKGLLGSKRERQFVRVIGDAGVYSLKRLQNVSI